MWQSEVGARSDSKLSRFGADLRYRFSERIPSLFRFALARDVVIRNLGHLETDLVVAYDIDIVQLLGSAGITFEANRGGVHFDARPGAGVSVRVKPDVRIGGELFDVYSFDSAVESWVAVGPSVAFTHGRFWCASTFAIGVRDIASAGRISVGIAF